MVYSINKNYKKLKNNSGVYIVQKIIKKNKNKYLVKWRGYSDDFIYLD